MASEGKLIELIAVVTVKEEKQEQTSLPLPAIGQKALDDFSKAIDLEPNNTEFREGLHCCMDEIQGVQKGQEGQSSNMYYTDNQNIPCSSVFSGLKKSSSYLYA